MSGKTELRWADVDDEAPPPMPASNDGRDVFVRKIETRPNPLPVQNGQSSREGPPKAVNNRGFTKPSNGSPRNLWEPPVMVPSKTNNETKHSVGKDSSSSSSRPPRERRKKNGNEKRAERFNREKKVIHELALLHVPDSVPDEEIRNLFGGEKVKLIKRVKDRLFIQFHDKESVDKGLAVTVPKYGNRDVVVSIPLPKGEKAELKKMDHGKKGGDGNNVVTERKKDQGKGKKPTVVVVQQKVASSIFAALDDDDSSSSSDEEEEEEEDDDY